MSRIGWKVSETAGAISLALLVALFSGIRHAGVVVTAQERAQRSQTVQPQYDEKGALRLPATYREWVFVGSSLGLSYTEGQAGMEMFHETLMEPTAYKHFVETGTFREGTMLALILHGTGQSVLPARRGRFAADIHGVEMAVKDSSHRAESWAYYNFGGMNGIRPNAQAMPKESCYTCHSQHAKRDNVFLQFYPLLADAARLSSALSEPPPAETTVEPTAARADAPSTLQRTSASSVRNPEVRLALKGLDPIALVDGREEMGKPEIIETHGPYRYQFVSEPNRARFAGDPARYAIQNTTCPVVSGAPVDPSLFAVHDGRIYGFGTSDCLERFRTQPAEFLKRQH
jgi:YHS domain-containing protein